MPVTTPDRIEACRAAFQAWSDTVLYEARCRTELQTALSKHLVAERIALGRVPVNAVLAAINGVIPNKSEYRERIAQLVSDMDRTRCCVDCGGVAGKHSVPPLCDRCARMDL